MDERSVIAEEFFNMSERLKQRGFPTDDYCSHIVMAIAAGLMADPRNLVNSLDEILRNNNKSCPFSNSTRQ